MLDDLYLSFFQIFNISMNFISFLNYVRSMQNLIGEESRWPRQKLKSPFNLLTSTYALTCCLSYLLLSKLKNKTTLAKVKEYQKRGSTMSFKDSFHTNGPNLSLPRVSLSWALLWYEYPWKSSIPPSNHRWAMFWGDSTVTGQGSTNSPSPTSHYHQHVQCLRRLEHLIWWP